jgi:tetratricopeptide (TPR) repeat protein
VGSFVGTRNHDLVDFLVERLQQIRRGEPVPRVVLLEAESGSGKSRIVREVYERLRSDPTIQPTNAAGIGYWPVLTSDSAETPPGMRGLPARKVLGPSVANFQRPEDSLPGFFWVPVHCNLSPDGTLTSVLELLWPTINAHARFVAAAWKKAATPSEEFNRWRTEHLVSDIKDLAGQGGLDALAKFLSVVGFDLLPGSGFMLSKAMQAFRGAQERITTGNDIREGGELDAPGRPAEELVEQLLRMVHADVPLIIVVEDLHLMDSQMADFLSMLALKGATKPILIIGTAWPEGRNRPLYQQWVHRMETMTSNLSTEIIGSATHRQFPQLSVDDRIALARQYAPNTNDALLRQIAEKWSNPYALKLTMISNRVRSQIMNCELQMRYEDLQFLPLDVKSIYQDRWLELDAQIRTALMIAAMVLPDIPDDLTTWPFMKSLVSQAATNATLIETSDSAMAALNSAIDPYEWNRSIGSDPDISEFREWVLQAIAHEAFNEQYPDATKDTLTICIIGELINWIDERRGVDLRLDYSDPAVLTICRWLMLLPKFLPASIPAYSIAVMALAHAASDNWQFQFAVYLITQRMDFESLPPNDVQTLKERAFFAHLLGEVGRTNDAIVHLRDLLKDQLRLLGPNHPDTLRTQLDLAASLGRAGRPEEAIVLLTGLLTDQIESHGTDAPDTLTIRNDLGQQLTEAGRLEAAVQLFTNLLADHLHILGPEHPSTLTIRHNLAYALAKAERIEDAVGILRELISDRTRILGPDHLDTFGSRFNLALRLSEAGRLDEAISDSETLLADVIGALGTEHQYSLLIRGNRAIWIGTAGNPRKAAEVLKELVPDMISALGPEHPDTLTVQSNLASRLGEIGRRVEAVAILRELLEKRDQLFGANHPSTVINRSNLAFHLVQIGQASEAIELYETFINEQQQQLGPLNPHVLEACDSLAHILVSARQTNRALKVFKDLVADQTSSFGPLDVRTLTTRNNIADTLAMSGRVTSALILFRALLNDMTPALGTDHHLTLTVRSNIGFFLERAGRLNEAIAVTEQLLADLTRLLGPSHRKTVSVRKNLEAYLKILG